MAHTASRASKCWRGRVTLTMFSVYGLRHLAAAARLGGFSAREPRRSWRLNGSTMNQYRNHHEREAARLRLLLADATTPRVKARLLDEVEKLDQLGGEDLDTPAV
jgi:hypothetical protein